jgi:hypothetical protein
MPTNNAPSLTPLLNEREARKVLMGISRATLYNYRKIGLPFIKLPGRIGFEQDAIRIWYAQYRESAPAREAAR